MKTLIIIVLIIFILTIALVTFFVCKKWYQKNRQTRLSTLAQKSIEGFERHKVNYWIDFGTLLGIIREGDIILYDSDVDFCLLPDPEIKGKLEKVVRDMGEEYQLEYHDFGAYRITHLKPFKIFADLYLIKEENNLYINPTGEKINKDLIGTPKILMWKGLKAKIPEKPVEVLTLRYGGDFMTPKQYNFW